MFREFGDKIVETCFEDEHVVTWKAILRLPMYSQMKVYERECDEGPAHYEGAF